MFKRIAIAALVVGSSLAFIPAGANAQERDNYGYRAPRNEYYAPYNDRDAGRAFRGDERAERRERAWREQERRERREWQRHHYRHGHYDRYNRWHS